jgi:hypothetical protein
VRRSVPSNPLRWFGDSPTTLTHPDDTASWERVAEAVGEPDPFVCKAAYVCGVVRQEVESAALLDAVRRHTASAQVLLGGVEVLGRGLCGHTDARGSGERLRTGLDYLTELQSKLRHLKEPPLDTSAWIDARHFTAHGSVFRERGAVLDRHGLVQLTYLLARSLDRYWTDPERRASFAQCTVLPGWTGGTSPERPIFVVDVLQHLRSGNKPSDGLPTDLPFLDVVRAAHWPASGLRAVLADIEDRGPQDKGWYVAPIATASPPVTGFGGAWPSAWSNEVD